MLLKCPDIFCFDFTCLNFLSDKLLSNGFGDYEMREKLRELIKCKAI